MFPSEHDNPQSCMQSHSDPHATVHLGLGISGQGTFVHVPSAAHTRPSFSRVYVCKYTYTVPEQAGFPKPHVQANTCTPYCPRQQPLLHRKEMPQEAFPLPHQLQSSGVGGPSYTVNMAIPPSPPLVSQRVLEQRLAFSQNSLFCYDTGTVHN